MAFLFFGHKAYQFKSTWSDGTTAAGYDSNYTDSYIQVPDGTNDGQSCYIPLGGPHTDVWFHMQCQNYVATSADDGFAFAWYGEDGSRIARMQSVNGSLRAQLFPSGVGGGTTGTGSFLPTTTRQPVDIRVTFNDGASGNITLEYYVNGVQVGSTTTQALSSHPATGIASIRIGGVDHGGWRMSEVMIADEDTRGYRLGQMTPDGAGNYSAWAGAGTNCGTRFNATGISSRTATDRESWSLSAYSGPASPTSIRGVFNQHHCKKGSSGPSQLDSFLRISSTDYDAGAQTPLPLGANIYEWANNPNTASAWATSDFASLEAGVEAVT